MPQPPVGRRKIFEPKINETLTLEELCLHCIGLTVNSMYISVCKENRTNNLLPLHLFGFVSKVSEFPE